MRRGWSLLAFYLALVSVTAVGMPCRSAYALTTEQALARVLAQGEIASVALVEKLKVLVRKEPKKYLPGVLALLRDPKQDTAHYRLPAVIYREFWHLPEVTTTIEGLLASNLGEPTGLTLILGPLLRTEPWASMPPLTPTIRKAVDLAVKITTGPSHPDPFSSFETPLLTAMLPWLKALDQPFPDKWEMPIANSKLFQSDLTPLILAWQKTYPGPALNSVIRRLQTAIPPQLDAGEYFSTLLFDGTPWEALPKNFTFADIHWPSSDHISYSTETKSSLERLRLQLESNPKLRTEAFYLAVQKFSKGEPLPHSLFSLLLLVKNKTPNQEAFFARFLQSGKSTLTREDLALLASNALPPLGQGIRQAIAKMRNPELRNLIVDRLHPSDLASPEIQSLKNPEGKSLTDLTLLEHSKLTPEQTRSLLQKHEPLADFRRFLLFRHPRVTRDILLERLKNGKLHLRDAAILLAMYGRQALPTEVEKRIQNLIIQAEPIPVDAFLQVAQELTPWMLDFKSPRPHPIRDAIRSKFQSDLLLKKRPPHSLSPSGNHENIAMALPIADPADISQLDGFRQRARDWGVHEAFSRADNFDWGKIDTSDLDLNPNQRTSERYNQFRRNQSTVRKKGALTELKLTYAQQNRWVEGQVLEWRAGLGEMSERLASEYGLPEMERALRSKLSFLAELQSQRTLSPTQQKQIDGLLDEIRFEQFRTAELGKIQNEFRREIRKILTQFPGAISLTQNSNHPLPGPALTLEQIGALDLSLTDSRFPIRFRGVPIKLGFSAERALGIAALQPNATDEIFAPYLRALNEGLPPERAHALGRYPILKALVTHQGLETLQSRYQKLAELVFSADMSVFEPVVDSQTWAPSTFGARLKNWLLHERKEAGPTDSRIEFIRALGEVYFDPSGIDENRLLDRELRQSREMAEEPVAPKKASKAGKATQSNPRNHSLESFLAGGQEKKFKVQNAPAKKGFFILQTDEANDLSRLRQSHLEADPVKLPKKHGKKPFRLIDTQSFEIPHGLSRVPNVELTTPVSVVLWAVHPDSRRRQKLVEGKDYRLRRDLRDGSLYVEYLNPRITHVQGEYAYSPEFKKTPVIQIGTENLPSTIRILQESGFTDLASKLEAWRSKNPRATLISHLELGAIAQSSSHYSFAPPPGKPAQNPTTLLDSLQQFIGPEGKTCLQCNGAAPLFKAIAELLDPERQYIEVDLAIGHLVSAGKTQVTAQDFHMRADIKKAGDPGPSHSFEVTPSVMDPVNPRMPVPESEVKKRLEAFRKWLARVMKWNTQWKQSAQALKSWVKERVRSHFRPVLIPASEPLAVIEIQPKPETHAAAGHAVSLPPILEPIHAPGMSTASQPKDPVEIIQNRLKRLTQAYRAQIRHSDDEPLMRLYRLLERMSRGETQGTEVELKAIEASLRHLQATQAPYNQSDLAPILQSLLDSTRGHLTGRAPASEPSASTRACELARLKQALHQAVEEVR